MSTQITNVLNLSTWDFFNLFMTGGGEEGPYLLFRFINLANNKNDSTRPYDSNWPQTRCESAKQIIRLCCSER